MLEIKVVGPGDMNWLMNVAEDVFDDPLVPASTEDFINDPRHRLVVALDNNRVVGFVSSVIYVHPDKSSPELWINEVGVAPTYQGRGIGKRLMQASLDEGKRSGCTEAWVLTEEDNTAARALYQSVGGEEEKPNPVLFTFGL